jgi:hypothetical protein
MTDTNNITGDKLISKELSPEGKANWDLIFGNKEEECPCEECEKQKQAYTHWVLGE